MLVQDFLTESARRLPDKVALACGEQRLTYREMDAASTQLASTLRRRGVARGDRVVVFAENSPLAAISFWAALKADAVVSMINAGTRAEKLAWLLENCRATALIASPQLEATARAAAAKSRWLKCVLFSAEPGGDAPPPRRNIDIDLAMIIYTSGSTGEPKGVMLTHRNVLAAAESISGYLGLAEDEVILGALPLSFDYGLYQMLMAFRAGARLVLEKSFAFPAQILQDVARERVTALPGVPTMFATFADMDLREFDLSSIRIVTNTAAALPHKHVVFLAQLFPKARIFSMYGLTECKRCTFLPPEDLLRKPGSVGIAIPNTELWLVDENDRRVGPGVTGQLVIRGATVMRGYWEKPEETAQRLRPGPLPGEQVLYTGDLCRLDEDGYLYFVARMDDVIKSRGEKVAPREVENALAEIEGVREAAVIGVPDEILGAAVQAFVAPRKGARLVEGELLKECRRRLEPFMVPKSIAILESLPRTGNGKIDKAALAQARPMQRA